MFTIFEARSLETGELVSGLTITAAFYDVNGSRTDLAAPTDMGNGRYSITVNETGTVVLDTTTEGVWLPILTFQYNTETDMATLQDSVTNLQENQANPDAIWSYADRSLTTNTINGTVSLALT